MTEYDILNTYMRVKIHFDHRVPGTYKSCEYYPSKAVEANRRNVDLNFLIKKQPNQITLYFIWLFYSKKYTLPKNNTPKLYASDEFKTFKESLKNYTLSMEQDFEIVYNNKGFDKFKTLIYKRKLNPITVWVMMNTVYKDSIHILSESNIFNLIWMDIKALAVFITLDKDFVQYYINKF